MATPSSTKAISCRELTKRFGDFKAVDGLTFDVRRGELVSLLGRNGAGKSTAISLLLGLQRPDQGSATLFDEEPQSIEARRRMFGRLQGQATIADEFDAPLPEEILRDFEGGNES